VSRGCSLQAAMLSPIFQVRNFDVRELYPFKVNIEFEKDGALTQSQLFGPVVKDGVSTPQMVPSIKNVAFLKTDPFSVKISYADDSDIGGVRDHTLCLLVLPHVYSLRSMCTFLIPNDTVLG
jgi:heat shock 70kDa protein 4